FATEFREALYPRVEEMQDILGLANDSHVAVDRLESLKERLRPMWGEDWKPLEPALTSLLRFHRRRLPKQRALFVQWWQQWHNADLPRMGELMTPKIETTPAVPPPPP